MPTQLRYLSVTYPETFFNLFVILLCMCWHENSILYSSLKLIRFGLILAFFSLLGVFYWGRGFMSSIVSSDASNGSSSICLCKHQAYDELTAHCKGFGGLV